MSARIHDLVLFGATGFTGRLVAEYLGKRAGGVRWALAGRNATKLDEVKRALGLDVPVIVADASDAEAMARVARGTRVVCTTVGPYAQLGRVLVAACAENGTSYCDLTGEVPFIRESIDRLDAKARETRARIVHCCGVDSVPSDLGTWLLGEHLRAKGEQLTSATAYYRVKGGLSGGTIASFLGAMEAAERDRELRRLLMDPYALLPDRTRDRGSDRGDPMGVHFDEGLGEWTGPWVMAAVNSRVVRRSNALLDFPWGRDFRYREVMSFGRGPGGLARASGIAAGVAGMGAMAFTSPGRRVLGRFLPKPGEGPSAESRASGYLRVRVAGIGSHGTKATARVEGKGDPGYAVTSVMLGESALCLAQDSDRLPERFGVLTPASALAMPLVERLRAAGMIWTVE